VTATVRLAARLLAGAEAARAAGRAPLFVMHGLLGSMRNWQAIGKALARQHPVVLVDLRNHGASPWSDEMDYPAMAADLLALADRFEVERFALLGHSMGGKVAMATALSAPDRVERAIIADIAPIPYAHDFEQYVKAMLELDLEAIDRRAAADAALAPAIDDQAIRQFLLQNLDFAAAGKAFWKPNLAVLDRSLDAITGWPEAFDAGRYDGPALAIRGGDSPYVSDAGEAALCRLMPAVELVTLDGTGHWLHAEQPQAFIAAVRDFLEG